MLVSINVNWWRRLLLFHYVRPLLTQDASMNELETLLKGDHECRSLVKDLRNAADKKWLPQWSGCSKTQLNFGEHGRGSKIKVPIRTYINIEYMIPIITFQAPGVLGR